MKQLDPKAVWLFFISFVLRWFFSITFLVGIFWGIIIANTRENIFNATLTPVSFDFLNWFWVIVPAYIIFCFIWAKLTYRFYRYELTDAGFRKELGVIYKKYVTIPYDRIQNVDIYRGIWARLLGLSDLNIQTAGISGAMGTEGRLPGLSREIAEQLRDELIQRARQSKNQGL